MLVRIGSRGSRLALTQAELAGAVIRAAGSRGRVRPDHDRRRPRPLEPVRPDRRARRVREGDRGGAARRADRRRRTLREGHDLDRHGRPRRSAPISSATIRATRSSAPSGSSPACGSARRRSAGARSCSRSTRRSRSSRSAATSTPACARRSERGLDALVLAACGLDRLGLADRIGAAAARRDDAARGGAGRARAPGARRRGGARGRRPTRPRRGGASRPSAPAWPRIGAGCLAPVAAHHDGERADGADRGRGRQLDRAARAATDPAARRGRAARGVGEARGVKVIVTRPRAQAQPLVGRLEELGYDVVECPLIEIVRTSDEPIDCAGYEWASSRARTAPTRSRAARATCRKVAAVGPGHGRDAAQARDRAGVRRVGVDRRTTSPPSSRSRRGR